MRRMTFLGSAPWAGKNQAREINTNTVPKKSFLFALMEIPFFLRRIARYKRVRFGGFRVFIPRSSAHPQSLSFLAES
jgi:hypothetical protein